MKKQDISLEHFKKVEKRRGFPSMPTNTYKYNKAFLLENQCNKSLRRFLCLKTPLQNNKKKQAFFGKQ